MKAQFIEFLHEHKIFEEFKTKIELKNECDLDVYLDDNDADDYFLNGFYWGDGIDYGYWEFFNDKWLETIIK